MRFGKESTGVVFGAVMLGLSGCAPDKNAFCVAQNVERTVPVVRGNIEHLIEGAKKGLSDREFESRASGCLYKDVHAAKLAIGMVGDESAALPIDLLVTKRAFTETIPPLSELHDSVTVQARVQVEDSYK